MGERNEPPSHSVEPSGRRSRKAVRALPSSRFMPIQSQPTASGAGIPRSIRGPARPCPATSKRWPRSVIAPAHRELRLAVVVAGLLGLRALARQALRALQQQRLRRRERRSSAKSAAVTRRAVRRRRCARSDQSRSRTRVSPSRRDRDLEAFARDALVVPELAALHVGHAPRARTPAAWPRSARSCPASPSTRLRKNVTWKPNSRSPARACPVMYHHSVRKRRMRAVVARKLQLRRRQRPGRAAQRQAGRRQHQRAPPHHQSSFTASTASRPAAARPASQAVTVPAATTAAHSASSRTQGSSRSMVQ